VFGELVTYPGQADREDAWYIKETTGEVTMVLMNILVSPLPTVWRSSAKKMSSLSRASNLPQPLPLYYSTAAIFLCSTGRNPMYLSVH
jgi:hypothetical protein